VTPPADSPPGAPLRALLTRRFAGLTVLMLVAVGLFLVAGHWQWSKHVARDAEIAATKSGADADPVPVESLLSTTHQVRDEDVYHPVTATGTYDAEHQLVVRYRPLDGTPGSHVLVPLDTPAGTLLVDRGFVAGSGPTVDAPPPPSGVVTVVARVREPESGAGTGGDPAGGSIRFLDVPTLAAWLDRPVFANYAELVSEDPRVEPAPQLLPAPTLDPGPYLSYGVQWYLFALVAVAGWVALGYRDVQEARRPAAQPAESGVSVPPAPSSR
jgi:cytochrome oxidase assembly protein ShyY1